MVDRDKIKAAVLRLCPEIRTEHALRGTAKHREALSQAAYRGKMAEQGFAVFTGAPEKRAKEKRTYSTLAQQKRIIRAAEHRARVEAQQG